MRKFQAISFKYVITLVFQALFVCVSYSSTFYLDPNTGDINNPGTIDQPWSSLREVIEANYISTNNYTPLPYDPISSVLAPKNINAPITAGDTLMLLGGMHGEVFLRNFVNDDYISIIGVSGERAIIEKIRMQACKYWRIENIEVSTEPYGYYLKDKLFFVESHNWHGPTSHIEISNCEIYSADQPWTEAQDWLDNASFGLFVNADNCSIKNNYVRNIDHGIIVQGDSVFAGENVIENFSGDGMRPLGSYVEFNGNLIKNCYDVDDNHDDGIQCFTTNGLIVDHVRLIGNTIINTDNLDRPLNGSLHGIGCFDGPYNHWEVSNNVISVNHWHGISLYEAHNCRVINNTVIDPTPEITPGGSWIRINPNDDGTVSTNNVVANNVANKIIFLDPINNNVSTNNIELLTQTEYVEHFVDFQNFDFRLISDSGLINNGELNYATAQDVDGVDRDLFPDIGAYEYIQTSAIDVIELEDLISIYPNPFSTDVSIDVDCQEFEIEVIDVGGNLILRATDNSINRKLTNLEDGVYFLKFINRSKDCFSNPLVRKLVKVSD